MKLVKTCRLLLLLGMLMMSACSVVPPARDSTSAPPTLYAQHLAELGRIVQFSLKGRIGVQTEKQGFSGSIQWVHAPAVDEISLFSPLGSQVASITSDNTGVRLINSDGKIYEEVSAETLTQKTLGWSLPMTGLSDWVLGRPTASTIKDISWDEEGRIKTLFQDGWQIEYGQYITINGATLPGKVFLKSPKLNLKFLIETWSVETDLSATNKEILN